MPKHYDILLLGHLSRSVHIKPDGEKLTWMGGALWYGVHSAFAGGNKVGAVVKCAPEDNESHSILPIPPKIFTIVRPRRACLYAARFFLPIRNGVAVKL